MLEYFPLPAGFKTAILPPREIGDAAKNGIQTISQMIQSSGPDANFFEHGRGPTAGEFMFRNVGFTFSSLKAGMQITLKQAVDVLGGIIDAAWDPNARYDEPARILVRKRIDKPEEEPYAFCYFVGDAWIPPDELKDLESSSGYNQTESSTTNGNFTSSPQTAASGNQYETYRS